MSLTEILSYPNVAAEFDKYIRVPAPAPAAPKMVAPGSARRASSAPVRRCTVAFKRGCGAESSSASGACS